MWNYGGSVIPDWTNIVIAEGDLKIEQTEYYNAGLYQCVARNTAGTSRLNFTLTINRDNSRIIILKTGKAFKYAPKITIMIKS